MFQLCWVKFSNPDFQGKNVKISFKYSPNFIFRRILRRKCTAALKPFLLTWNGSCTTASSTTEVNLFDVPAASSQASSQSAVDLPTLFQVTTNWLQPQRSSSRFASTRYRALLENDDCAAVRYAAYFSSIFHLMTHCALCRWMRLRCAQSATCLRVKKETTGFASPA